MTFAGRLSHIDKPVREAAEQLIDELIDFAISDMDVPQSVMDLKPMHRMVVLLRQEFPHKTYGELRKIVTERTGKKVGSDYVKEVFSHADVQQAYTDLSKANAIAVRRKFFYLVPMVAKRMVELALSGEKKDHVQQAACKEILYGLGVFVKSDTLSVATSTITDLPEVSAETLQQLMQQTGGESEDDGD